MLVSALLGRYGLRLLYKSISITAVRPGGEGKAEPGENSVDKRQTFV